tara:strand:+ start:3652 stop:4308 length:657 start_codon:yes stop_codon:yes gene_type:complete
MVKRLLEIFCGTKSLSKVFEKNNWEVYTIDIEKKYNPSECVNVLDWDYTKFDKDYFNHIHLSPPCIYMSQNQQTWYNRFKGRGDKKYLFTKEIHLERLKESDILLYKCVEILDYFNNNTFTIENPYHNKFNSICNRNIINYDYTIADYCMYNYPIKKPTIFFNNFNLNLKRCDRTHTHTSYKKYCGGGDSPKDKVYQIPEELCNEILKQVEFYYIHII